MKKLSLVLACVGFISAASFAQEVKKQQAAPAVKAQPQAPATVSKTPAPMSTAPVSKTEMTAPVSKTETSGGQPQKIEGVKVMKRPAIMVPTKKAEIAQPVQPLNK